MFWRDMTLSIWRKKTTGLKTKKRLLPLMLAAALCSSPVWAEEATFTAVSYTHLTLPTKA